MAANIDKLKLKREEMLENILKTIKSWDGSYEVGISIIDDVDLALEELKSINGSIETISASIPPDEIYRENMTLIVKEYEDLLKQLEIERKKLLELIKETRLKDEVKNSYIFKKKNSIFIDKDL